MGKTAGMVKAAVVKAGGVALVGAMSCEQVCAAFTPPIKFGSHAKMQGSKKGYQAEHIIPASTFHKKGRKGAKIKDCSGYSTSKAQTWMVSDGQTAKKEHKILTDKMKEFSQANFKKGRQASLGEWLDKYKEGVEDALKNGTPKRKIKDDKLDKDALYAKAAECIRAHAAESFANMTPPIDQKTPLRNSWTKKTPRPAKKKPTIGGR